MVQAGITNLLILRSQVYDTITLCRYASANTQVAVTTLFFVCFLCWYSTNGCEYGWFYKKTLTLLTAWHLALKQMNAFVLFFCSYLISIVLWSSGCCSAGIACDAPLQPVDAATEAGIPYGMTGRIHTGDFQVLGLFPVSNKSGLQMDFGGHLCQVTVAFGAFCG